MIKHLPDLLADSTVLESDIICLQETWVHANYIPQIPGYTVFFDGVGKGKGVATFIRNHLVERQKLRLVEQFGNEDHVQGLKLYFNDVHIINVYRPPNPTSNKHLEQFMQTLREKIDPEQQTVICGDLNFNFLREPRHKIVIMLDQLGFQQIVRQPTTIHGSCLDQVYLRGKLLFKYKLHYPYYSDHECVCVMLKKELEIE